MRLFSSVLLFLTSAAGAPLEGLPVIEPWAGYLHNNPVQLDFPLRKGVHVRDADANSVSLPLEVCLNLGLCNGPLEWPSSPPPFNTPEAPISEERDPQYLAQVCLSGGCSNVPDPALEAALENLRNYRQNVAKRDLVPAPIDIVKRTLFCAATGRTGLCNPDELPLRVTAPNRKLIGRDIGDLGFVIPQPGCPRGECPDPRLRQQEFRERNNIGYALLDRAAK